MALQGPNHSTPPGSEEPFFVAVRFRRFHLRPMILSPFGEQGRLTLHSVNQLQHVALR